MVLRKTKIVCTMGPTVRHLDIIKQLLVNGMNIARFNFSHGDYDYHKEMMEMVREASQQTGIPVGLLLDTKGPEIRTGLMEGNQLFQLFPGNKIVLTTDEIEGTSECISISYKHLPQEVSPGKHIYIADGVIDLEIERIQGHEIFCLIREGGTIGNRKNINVVGVRTALPALSDKDKEDILFGIGQYVDFIAASFIRKSSDILEIRTFLEDCKAKIAIVAKIEDEEGVENIDDIIALSDGIMIARGDLGVQLNTEEIPLVQKRIIRKCNRANKPVITATQMLDSMIHNPRPTRAEASDVANAIFDGTDAVMLSGETASGTYPILAVKTMHKLALNIENSVEYQEKMRTFFDVSEKKHDIATAIAQSAVILATDINASAILTPTLRGTTPKLISRYRSSQPIIAITTTESVRRTLLLYWGIYPVVTNVVSDSALMINNAISIALRKKYVRNSDKVIMVAGIPVQSPVMLNTIRVHIISTILGKGLNGLGKVCTGRIVKAHNLNEATRRIQGRGDEILLTRTLDKDFLSLLPKLQGIILEEYTTLSSQDILKNNSSLTLISGVPEALTTLEHDLIVTLDGEEKLIYEGVVEEK